MEGPRGKVEVDSGESHGRRGESARDAGETEEKDAAESWRSSGSLQQRDAVGQIDEGIERGECNVQRVDEEEFHAALVEEEREGAAQREEEQRGIRQNL